MSVDRIAGVVFAISAAALLTTLLSVGYLLANPEVIGEYVGRLVAGFHST